MQLATPEQDILADSAQAADDLRIIALARTDPRAFGPLYDRYADPIYFFCYRRLNHADDAADATSLVFTRALEALPRFQPRPSDYGSTVRAWLFTIARRVVVDVQRRKRPQSSIDAPNGFAGGLLTDPGPGPEDLAVGRSEADRLHFVLAALPDRQRAVIELRLSGLTMPEIAVALNQSVSATKSLQVRAYRLLRELLLPSTDGEFLP
jgi:RNA polymerase sigma-70 factor (ECF subfamily)